MIALTNGLKVSIDLVIGSLEATGQQELAASSVATLLETIKNTLPSWEAVSNNSVVAFVTDGHYLPGTRPCFTLL